MRPHPRNLLLPGILWLALSVQSQTSTPIPATFFGMHVSSPDHHWPTIPFGSLAKCDGAVWYVIQQKSRNDFYWWPVDRCVRAAEEHGMDFFVATEGIPPWAARDSSSCYAPGGHTERMRCSSGVRNMGDWDNFVSALVTRYKGKLIYELWNEPHGGEQQEGGTVKDLVELTQHEYNIIRSIDSKATILSPSFPSFGYMDQYFANGGPRGVDGITFHGNAAEPEELLQNIRQVRQIAAKYGMANQPLWATEGGHWGRRDLSPQARAAFVARVELLYWSAGVVRHYWYAWDNPNFGTLWQPDAGLTAAGKAYQQIYQWMVGAVLDKPCESQGATWTCKLSRPGGYEALAVWRTTGSSSYPPARQYTQYRNLDGDTFPIDGSVTIGIKPILLEKPARN